MTSLSNSSNHCFSFSEVVPSILADSIAFPIVTRETKVQGRAPPNLHIITHRSPSISPHIRCAMLSPRTCSTTARIYASATEPYVSYDFDYFDPESGWAGGSPVYRTLLIGANVSF